MLRLLKVRCEHVWFFFFLCEYCICSTSMFPSKRSAPQVNVELLEKSNSWSRILQQYPTSWVSWIFMYDLVTWCVIIITSHGRFFAPFPQTLDQQRRVLQSVSFPTRWVCFVFLFFFLIHQSHVFHSNGCGDCVCFPRALNALPFARQRTHRCCPASPSSQRCAIQSSLSADLKLDN